MPKAATSQTPTSPGSAGAAEVQVRTNAVPLRLPTEGVSSLYSIPSRTPNNGHPRSFPSFETWPPELDDELRKVLLSTPGAERNAIAAIKDSHHELTEDLIWSRIVYLGLTNRKRAPYRKHEWTTEEDEILLNQYGSSRAASRKAIEHILRLHPDWSRDAVVWRARVLGLTQHRATAPQRWSSAQDHYLLSLMGCQLETIARRLNRSKKSVLARLRRLGWSADFFGGFKTKDLVLDLRVSEAVVEEWVRSGWLERKNGRITEESLRWLCRHHSEEIPFQSLTPEAQNWLTLSMGYGRGDTVRRGGRTKKSDLEGDTTS